MARELIREAEAEAPDLPQSQPYPVLQVLHRRKSYIVLGALVGAALGALYYAGSPPVYEAKAQLLVIQKRPEGVPGMEHLLYGGDDYLSTQVGILKSPLMADRAVRQQGLASAPGLAASGDVTTRIVAGLKVTRDAKDLRNNILDLAFQSSDPQAATAVLAALIDAYKGFLDETYRNGRDETVKFVTKARNELEKELTDKEEKYRALRRKTPVLLMKGQNGAAFNADQLLVIHSKQLEKELRRKEIERGLNQIDQALRDGRSREELTALVSRLVDKSAGSDAAGNQIANSLQQQLLPALLEEKMLLRDYGESHPDVRAAQKKIDLARAFVLATLRQELKDLKASEELLARAFEEHTGEAQKAVDFDLDDEGYRSEIVRLQQLYDVTIKRLQEADLVKDLGGFDAQTVAPPVSRKVGPKALTIFPAALLLGLLLGGGLGYWAELADKTFRSAEEIKRRLGAPVIGHIPRIELKQPVLEEIAASGSAFDAMLCAYHRPKSREAEGYRGIRTSLYFSTRGSGHRVIQISSPNAGDGKTTLAANLAVSIAQTGKRVLLIDADLRKPRVHKVFNLSAKVGFGSVLADKCELAEAIQDVGIPGLFVVPCGKLPANPAELLTSPRLKELIDAVREQYDFVLIDTPPMLAVTDPSVVAPRVDGVLLTMRITKNGRPAAERSKDMLQTLGAPIFGVVVNGVAARGTGYGGYGYYREGYYNYYYYNRDYSYNSDTEKYYEDNGDEAAAEHPGSSNGAIAHPENGNGQG